MEIKDFYKEIETTSLESEDQQLPEADKYKKGLKGKSGTEKVFFLGQLQQKLAEQAQALTQMMNRAKSGLTGALDELVEKFSGKEPSVFTVKLDKSMVDRNGMLLLNGVTHEKFGAKRIEDDSHMARLERDVEIAKAYFPDAQLSEITDAKGNRVAIVTGLDAKQFNAVVRADREMVRLVREQEIVAEERLTLQRELGLNVGTGIAGGHEARAETYALSPAGAKTRSNEIS